MVDRFIKIMIDNKKCRSELINTNMLKSAGFMKKEIETVLQKVKLTVHTLKKKNYGSSHTH